MKYRLLYGLVGLMVGVSGWGQVTYDWLDTAPDGNWRRGADGARWSGGLWDEPGSGILRFNNNHQLNMTNNVLGTYSQHKITFDNNNTNSRTIGGNTVQLFENGTTWPWIQNLSNALHSINFPVIGPNASFNLELIAEAGPLAITGTINNNARGVMVYGNEAAVDGINRYIRLGGIVSNTGLLNISRFGVARLATAHTYTGETQIDNGELWIENGGDITGGGGIFIGNGTQTANTAKLWLSNPGGGTTFSRPITINPGNATTREIGGLNTSGTHTFSGNITHASNNGLFITSLNTGATLVIAGVISGTSPKPVTYNGSGTIIVSGDNTYVGANTINAGTRVKLGGNIRALGGGTTTTTILAGGVLDLNGFTLFNAKPLNLSGTGIGGIGAVTNNPDVTSTSDYSGSLTLGGNATITCANGDINFTTTTIMGGTGFTLTLGGNFNGSLGSRIETGASAALTKEGTGTWTLSGASTYGGATTINGGTLRISGADNRLPINTALIIANTAGATLDLNNQNQQIGSLAGGGNTGAVTLGIGALTVGNATNTTFEGSISGINGSVTKLGASTLTLNGANTYTGSTTITAGTLAFNSNASLSPANVTLNGGILAIGNIPTGTLSTGIFNMSANSSIDLGTGSNSFNLNFSGFGGTFIGTLTINNWSGTAGKEIYIPGPLSPAQLANINFTGYGTGAKYDAANLNRIIPAFVYETQTTGSGLVSDAGSWTNGIPPNNACGSNPASIIIRGTFNLTQNEDRTYSRIEVNNGSTYTATANTITLCAGATFLNNGTVNFTGTSTVMCNSTATFSGGAASANFGLNSLTINAATIITTAPIIRGTLQLNPGSSVTAAPVYTNSSTLVYNTGGAYGMNNEWMGNGTTAGTGIPQNVTVQTTTLNFPNTNRGCAGNFIITTGNAVLNATSGDLYVAGNFTNNGTFTHNNRALFMVGGNEQTLNGTLNANGANNCFPFLLLNKTGGTVLLGTPVNVTNTLTLTNGNVTLGNNNLTITSGTAIAGAPFSNTKMIITNGSGNLIFNVITDDANTRIFPIGESTNYTPITINITASTGTGRTLGMRVVDDASPNINTPTPAINYLTRYYEPNAQGFTSISYTGSFTYAAGDEVGPTPGNLRYSVWYAAPENTWIEYGSGPSGTTLSSTANTLVGSLTDGAQISGREFANKLFYRSIASGNWNNTATWETATDAGFTSLITPTPTPPSALNSNGITIRNLHVVTINADATLDQCVIQNGGVLIKGAANLTINDGPDTDLEILNGGIFRHSGSPTTIINGQGIVQTGGTIEITNNSANSHQYASSNNMSYETDAVFFWNINGAFGAAGITFFPNATSTIPIFRCATVTSGVGGSTGANTIINGVFDAVGNVNWINAGVKIFRNGITGLGSVTQHSHPYSISTNDCGPFQISGTTSVLGGATGTINLNTAGLQITAGTCTMLSSKPIEGNGTFTVNNGATLDAGLFSLTGSAPFTLATGGTLISANTAGVNGSITTSGTKSFQNFANYTFNGSLAQNTGSLMDAIAFDININNAAGVTLTNNAIKPAAGSTTTRNLNLQSGNLTIGSGGFLYMEGVYQNGATARNCNPCAQIIGSGGNVTTGANGGTIHITGPANINSATVGWPSINNMIITTNGVNAGVDFASNALISNSLQIDVQGFVNPRAPSFAVGSNLVYNAGGTYNRSVEWGQITPLAPGYPHHVIVQNNTTLNLALPDPPPSLEIGGDLTIGNATTYGRVDMNDADIALEVNGNLLIGNSTNTSGNELRLSNIFGGDLWLHGNFTRHGANFYIDRDRAIFFKGSEPLTTVNTLDVTITPGVPTQYFSYAIVDKAVGTPTPEITLNCPVGIVRDMNFINGIVNSTNTNLLLFEPAATVAGGNNNSFTNGPVAKQTTNDAQFIFPIGKTAANSDTTANIYRPAHIAPITHNDTTTYTAEFYFKRDNFTPPLSSTFTTNLTGIWANHRWEVTKSGSATSTGRLGIPYKTDQDTWIPFGPFITSNVAVARYNNTTETWAFTKFYGFSNNPPFIEAQNHTVSPALIWSDALTEFSPFTMGFGFDVVLPLQLLHFSAALTNGDGLLQWRVADDKDLLHFDIEYSTDGRTFKRLATQGNTGSLQYSYRHRALAAGIHYYRLRMVERNGMHQYSRTEVLQVGKQRTVITGLLQNPVVGTQAMVGVQSAVSQTMEATVIDAAGRMLLRHRATLHAGTNTVTVPVLLLPQGMYRLVLYTADGVQQVMLFVK